MIATFLERQKHRILVLVLVLVSLGVTYYCCYPSLVDRYTVEDDVDEYVFPIYGMNDKSLFQNDLFSAFSLNYNSKGVVAVYRVLSRLMDPLDVSKILPFPLSCMAAVYIFLIGRKFKSNSVGFFASLIFILHSWTFYCYPGGHACAFAFPLLLGFLYHVMKRQYTALAVFLFLQVFFYPPMAVISILLLFLLAVSGFFKEPGDRTLWTRGFIFTGLLMASVTAAGYLLYLCPDRFMGPLCTLFEALKMPEFHAGGRDAHFFNLSDMFQVLGDQAFAENISGLPLTSLSTWLLVAMAGGGWLVAKKENVKDRVLNALLLSGIILFVSAWVVFLYLFSPGRYLKYPLPPVLAVYGGVAAAYCYKSFFSKNKVMGALIISMVLVIMYTPFLSAYFTTFTKHGLYSFLESTPKNALIAGHPDDVNEISVFAKRKVFVDRELSLPYYKNYYAEVKQRTRDFFKMYYASSWAEVLSVGEQRGIDYIVVNKNNFKKEYLERGDFYMAPFNDGVRDIVARHRKDGFVLSEVPPGCRVYEDEDFIVVKLSLLRSL